MRFLVVDDLARNRELLRLMLESMGHEVHEAVSGPEAVAQVAVLHPDVVWMDVFMPGEYDGLEATRRIKADPALSCRIVVQTARPSHLDVQQAKEAGADEVLLKPFKYHDVVDRVVALGKL